MDKVKIVFYENYGNKKIKTVHNVIPTSISTRYRMGCYGKREIYLNYDIMDEISHHGCFALNEGIVYSIFPENNTQKENQKKVIHELSKKVIEQLKKRENLNCYGKPLAWIDLPSKKLSAAEIIYEDGYYSTTTLFDLNGRPSRECIEEENLYTLLKELICD